MVLLPLVGRPALKGLSTQTLYVMQMISVLKLSFVSLSYPLPSAVFVSVGVLLYYFFTMYNKSHYITEFVKFMGELNIGRKINGQVLGDH